MVRITWVDWIKTISILLVVVGHHSGSPEWLLTIIYGFHLPLFLIVSGYLFKCNSICKITLRFLIPIVVFTIVGLFLRCLISSDGFVDVLTHCTILDYRADAPNTILSGLWFVQVLWAIEVICTLVESKTNRHLILEIIGVSICIMYIVFLSNISDVGKSFYLYRIFGCFPFFVFGRILKQTAILETVSKINAVSILVLLLIWSFFIVLNGRCDIYGLTYGRNYIIFFANAIVLGVLLIRLFSYLKGNAIVQTISSGTIAILFLHRLVFEIINQISIVLGFSRIPYLACIVESMFVIILLYPFIKITLCYCPYIYGKTGSNNKC